MMNDLVTVLQGAVAMASLTAALFFLRFWRQTRDVFFALFAFAFAVDAASRVALGLTHSGDEHEPLFYLARLVMFLSIILAIVLKNRPSGGTPP